MELMRNVAHLIQGIVLAGEDTLGRDLLHFYSTRAVDNGAVANKDTYMGDLAIAMVEEREVTSTRELHVFRSETYVDLPFLRTDNQFALRSLL